MKWKLTLLLTGCLLLNILTSCKVQKEKQQQVFFKGITKVSTYGENLPVEFQFFDYQSKAKLYDELVFLSSEDDIPPLSWQDKTNGVLAIPAYVGDNRFGENGTQEAVTFLPAILSGTYVGIDKSSQNGIDYVSMADIFFSKEEKIIVNNPGAVSADASMWYLLYPSILYTQIAVEYKNETLLEHALSMIEQWHGAYEVMISPEYSSFDYTGFDFSRNEPYKNGVWTEPDCAVGIAVLMDYGYELTGDKKYNKASIELMDYMEDYFGSPLYEALMYFGPALAAKMNALYGTDYNIDKALDRTFGDGSIPRGGWGSISGEWGGYNVNGLFGSAVDGGGYAFSMNTFTAAKAITPMVRYDSRYGVQIGKWLLYVHQNSRHFFSKESDGALQSYNGEPLVNERILEAIPYEGVRKEKHGTSPWIGGDPLEYGWAQTDFSLYSGAHVGMFASLFQETNVDGILQINTSNLMEDASCYLLYNPYGEEKTVKVKLSGSDKNLYESVSNQILEISSEFSEITIPAESAVVITEIPRGSIISEKDNSYYADEAFIGAKKLGVFFDGLQNNQLVSGKISFSIEVQTNFKEAAKPQVTVTLDGEELKPDKYGNFTIDTEAFEKGRKKLTAQAVDADGLHDEISIRITFE